MYHGQYKKAAGDLAKTALTGGLYDPLSQGYQDLYKGPADEVKAAYDKAMGMAQDYGTQNKDFLLGREQNAENYYAPLRQLFTSAYGTQGKMAPQIPGVPGAAPIKPGP